MGGILVWVGYQYEWGIREGVVMLNEYSFNFMDSKFRLWHDVTPYEKLR